MSGKILLCFICMMMDGTEREAGHEGIHGSAARKMRREQGAAIVTGGGIGCSDCKEQQPASGMLNGAGQCSGCAS